MGLLDLLTGNSGSLLEPKQHAEQELDFSCLLKSKDDLFSDKSSDSQEKDRKNDNRKNDKQ